MIQRPESGLFGGLFDLPIGERATAESLPSAARRIAADRLGLTIRKARKLGDVEHQLTHRKLMLSVIDCEWGGKVQLVGFTGHRWETVPDAFDLGISTLAKKALSTLD